MAGFAASMIGGDWPSQRVLFFAMGAMTGFSGVRYSGPARQHGRRAPRCLVGAAKAAR